MAALAKDRNTPRAQGDDRQGSIAAATAIFAGAIVMRNAAGYLIEGQTATALVGVGRAEARVDNSAGGNGAPERRLSPWHLSICQLDRG